MELSAGLHGLAREESTIRITSLVERLELADAINSFAEDYSRGMKKKLGLILSMLHQPKLLILDEPTNGLDVLATRSLRESLRRLRDEQHKCIVFSTHIMQEVERLCDRVVVVSHGRTVAEGTVPELLERTGDHDFEACFVKLAFAEELAHEASGPEGADAAATGGRA